MSGLIKKTDTSVTRTNGGLVKTGSTAISAGNATGTSLGKVIAKPDTTFVETKLAKTKAMRITLMETDRETAKSIMTKVYYFSMKITNLTGSTAARKPMKAGCWRMNTTMTETCMATAFSMMKRATSSLRPDTRITSAMAFILIIRRKARLIIAKCLSMIKKTNTAHEELTKSFS
jgi:hypothetical protein